MKRIIDGLVYNTATATLVAVWGQISNADALYITKHGRWFQGPSDDRRPTLCLYPLTEDEAMSLLESHNEVEALETHLAHRIEEA